MRGVVGVSDVCLLVGGGVRGGFVGRLGTSLFMASAPVVCLFL